MVLGIRCWVLGLIPNTQHPTPSLWNPLHCSALLLVDETDGSVGHADHGAPVVTEQNPLSFAFVEHIGLFRKRYIVKTLTLQVGVHKIAFPGRAVHRAARHICGLQILRYVRAKIRGAGWETAIIDAPHSKRGF